jgi:Zn-finger nucleic acid-binding protein
MSEVWDDRKRALEEDYFRKKDQEAIEKMRQHREAEATRAAALKCPKCEGALAEMKVEEVVVDRCDTCHGIWLDAGELEQLTAKEAEDGWFSRMLQSFAKK